MRKKYEVTVEFKSGDWNDVAPSPEDVLCEIYDTVEMAEEKYSKLAYLDLTDPEKIRKEFAPAKAIFELDIDEEDFIAKRSMMKQEALPFWD